MGSWHWRTPPAQPTLKAEAALWPDQVAQAHGQLGLEHFQGQTLQKIFGELALCLTVLTGEKVFIQ